ncbi:AMP-binding protein [Myroides guanonis]|uniref:O-succinylbenzoic acid--CoA ligase n=1 Tax=Myroides guanonis TaxID=1150112 RepID=A0A1I3P9A4_9FLAO|nr:AMP-binding protein [Myroides guanonis]SFJ18073.1 O-succinylbenzoic acid--CoA ligase [Myroides guanonis]
MKKFQIHPDFKLNGQTFDELQLQHLAFMLIKDGNPFEEDLGNLILQWFDDNDFVLLTTSGTTGAPKEIELNKEHMIASAKATAAFFGVFEKTKALLCLPTRYIAGKMMFVRAMILGWELDFVEPTSSPLDGITKDYDFCAMVPLQVENSLDNLHRIEKIIVGGARISTQLHNKLEGIDTSIYETYGMTETITHIAIKKLGEVAFTVLPHVVISTDSRGCLLITAPEITDEPVQTNDIVDIIDDKHFVWKGRIDNVVNSGGVKLFPEQIEERLAHYIPYRFFIIGKEDEVLGEKVVLVIESEPYVLKDEVFESLSKYEKPKEIQFVPEFEETPTGKILRRKILV